MWLPAQYRTPIKPNGERTTGTKPAGATGEAASVLFQATAVNDTPSMQRVTLDHTWEEPGPLGLELEEHRADETTSPSGVKVSAVTKEAIPAHLAGLHVEKVNGEDVSKASYTEAMAKIEAAGRPLTLSFKGTTPPASPALEASMAAMNIGAAATTLPEAAKPAASPGENGPPPVDIAELPELIAGVNSNDRAQQREATVKIRKLLSIGEIEPALAPDRCPRPFSAPRIDFASFSCVCREQPACPASDRRWGLPAVRRISPVRR